MKTKEVIYYCICRKCRGWTGAARAELGNKEELREAAKLVAAGVRAGSKIVEKTIGQPGRIIRVCSCPKETK